MSNDDLNDKRRRKRSKVDRRRRRTNENEESKERVRNDIDTEGDVEMTEEEESTNDYERSRQERTRSRRRKSGSDDYPSNNYDDDEKDEESIPLNKVKRKEKQRETIPGQVYINPTEGFSVMQTISYMLGLRPLVCKLQEWCYSDTHKIAALACECVLLGVYIYMCIVAALHGGECLDGSSPENSEDVCGDGSVSSYACNVPLGVYLGVEGGSGVPFIILIGMFTTFMSKEPLVNRNGKQLRSSSSSRRRALHEAGDVDSKACSTITLITILGVFKFIWFVLGSIWVFSTSSSDCSSGGGSVYTLSMSYIIATFIIILLSFLWMVAANSIPTPHEHITSTNMETVNDSNKPQRLLTQIEKERHAKNPYQRYKVVVRACSIVASIYVFFMFQLSCLWYDICFAGDYAPISTSLSNAIVPTLLIIVFFMIPFSQMAVDIENKNLILQQLVLNIIATIIFIVQGIVTLISTWPEPVLLFSKTRWDSIPSSERASYYGSLAALEEQYTWNTRFIGWSLVTSSLIFTTFSIGLGQMWYTIGQLSLKDTDDAIVTNSTTATTTTIRKNEEV